MTPIKHSVSFKNMAAAANQYFKLQNPTTSNGDYHKSNSIAGKLEGRFLIELSKSRVIPRNVEVLFYLFTNIELLITGTPYELNAIKQKLGVINCNTELGKTIKEIFNYTYFRKEKAFTLYKLLDLPVCPYCNRQFLSSIETKRKKQLLFDLDHYFDQASYPYLALSFYNLIPSCHTCNSHLKHDEKFTLRKHLHPYIDSFDDILAFRTSIKDVSLFYSTSKKFHLYFIPTENPLRPISSRKVKKAKRISRIFKLGELYNGHKEYVQELIQRRITYPSGLIVDMYTKYAGTIFDSLADAERMFFGNYTQETDLHKRPLAKLTKDIAKEFKLI